MNISKSRCVNLAFISMHPAPYRDALIGKLIRSFRGDVDVFNLYGSDAGHRFWSLADPEYATTCIVADTERVSQLRLAFRLIRKFVFSGRYDCVVWPGYVHWSVRVAILMSTLLRRKYILSIDSVEQPHIAKIAFVIKKWMIKHAAILFVPGKASKTFLMKTFDVEEARIVCGAYALDGGVLEKKILELRTNGARTDVREKLGARQDTKMFLMVANMIPTRMYPITSAGFVEFAAMHKDCVFVMVGKGPEYEQMRSYASKNQCLRVIEGCSFDDMLKLYAAADVYVHGGKEPASTALVIGAIAHLPLISSDAVGCSADLLIDGETGFKVDNYTTTANWREIFARSIHNEFDWGKMGGRARTASKKLDANVVADKLSSCIVSLLK